jgi:cytochrome b6-f complex iron-sulfur subunit
MNAAVAQELRSDVDPKNLKLREILSYLLMIVLLLLVGFATRMLFQYIIPEPTLVVLGSLIDFPVSAEPYHVVNEKADVYLFNTGEEWLALDLRTPHTEQCRVRWVSPNLRFEDPCSGSKFARNGGYLEGPAWGHLDRYAVQVTKNGNLSINLTAPLVDSQVEFVQRCLDALHSDAEPALNRIWPDASEQQSCVSFWQIVPRKGSIYR